MKFLKQLHRGEEINVCHSGHTETEARRQETGEEVRHSTVDPDGGHHGHPLLQGQGDQRRTHEHCPGENDSKGLGA